MEMKKLVLSMIFCLVLTVPAFSVVQQPTDDSGVPDKAS
jgi:hypothetical protein